MIRNVLELGIFDIINKQWHYFYAGISYKLCFTYSHCILPRDSGPHLGGSGDTLHQWTSE